MHISCWKALGSSNIDTSTTLLKEFNEHIFHPHGIITTLHIELGGNIVSIFVEVINAPLGYKFLIGCTWFYKMTPVVLFVFRVLCFPHQGKILMIDKLAFCTLDLRYNGGYNVPFFGDTQQYSLSVGTKTFKHPSLMGIFSLPPPAPIANISAINMISSFTSGSLSFVDPWVIPRFEDVESYGASKLPTMVDIFNPKISSILANTSKKLYPHMECDHPTLLVWFVDSPSSHDFLNTELPSKEAILEAMASLDNPKDRMNHQSSLPDLELMRVSMMSIDLRLGEFTGESSRPPSLDPFLPQISFLELSTEFYASLSIEDLCFVPPSCLDGSHQGVVIAQKTTHDEYLHPWRFIPMWYGPDMVRHMMPTSAHEFIDDEKDPFLEPSHGIYIV
jgi:hypothetical protein